MKKCVFFVGIKFFVLFLGISLSHAQQAEYNVSYDFFEWGPGVNQGPVDVGFYFNGYTSNANYAWFDLYEQGNRQEQSFPASANTDIFFLHFGWGGDGQQRFDYTNDVRNVYKATSYWTKKYPLRPYTGNNQYRFWTSNSADWFSVTIYPKNLKIQSVNGPKDGSAWVLSQNDQTTLNATPGFPSDAYTWKYQITNTGPWIDFPVSYQGNSSISFTGNNLLGIGLFNTLVNSSQKINVSIWYKNINGSMTNNNQFESLTPKFNAPKIVSATKQLAKCSYSTTTSVKIKLDKAIGAGRKLEILNLKVPASSGTPFLITDDSLNASLEYELKGLAINSNYNIRVAGYYQGINSLAGTFYVTPTAFNYNTNNILPPALQLEHLINKQVFCHGGQDGRLMLKAKGGTSPYLFVLRNKILNQDVFSNTQPNPDPQNGFVYQPINDLVASDYRLSFTDKNGCLLAEDFTMTQPPAPLSVSDRIPTEVSGYGLSNGAVTIKLTGGTAVLPQAYPSPKITHSNGAVYTGQFVAANSNQYEFQFQNLPAGTYALRAEDAAYTPNKAFIRDSLGCLAKENLTIIQPPPLVLSIEETQSITCFGGQNGTLVAHGKGGKRFPTGLPYTYTWSYSKDNIAAYTSISTTDSVLSNRKAGYYKLLLKDKNNNSTTETYQLTEPLPVDADVSVKNVTCLNWTDGAITLSNLRGGKAPYAVQWYNGASTMSVSNLGHGFYSVTLRDDQQCATTKNIQVKDTLNEITLTRGSYLEPYCHGDANGSLGVQVQVASAPYTVSWNTGATDTLITGIPAGTYTVQVLNSKNCLKEATFILGEPKAIPLELEAERYLCIDQEAAYDITVKDSAYQYAWQGPGLASNQAQVVLSQEGTYTARIEDTKGCSIEKSVSVYRVNQTIASEFVVSTQVFSGDEVSLVNITQAAFADTSVWDFHDHPDVEVITNSLEYATVVFQKPGIYTVGLSSQQDRCTKVLEKQVKVVEPSFDHKPYSGATSFIHEFEIRPNPTDGRFEVMIRLEDLAAVKLRFLDFYSNSDIAVVEAQDQKDYVIPMEVRVAPGTYVLFLETPYGTRITKVIIM